MRPILLKGHERSITDLVFSREGDLIFTAAKTPTVAVWWTDNGERLGTYTFGGASAIWSLDVDRHTERLYTGSADTNARIWDVRTGQIIDTWGHKAPIRVIKTSLGDKEIMTVTDAVFGYQSTVKIWDPSMRRTEAMAVPIDEFSENSKYRLTKATWGPLNRSIVLGSETGTVRIIDRRKGQTLKVIQDHKKSIQAIAWDPHQIMFLTASQDGTARLYDAKTFEPLKVYTTGRPINAASIHPYRDEIILGGGQTAESVTTTRVDPTQFRIRFFHLIFETELGSGVQGHFGPVNVASYFPDGRGFASGGEDGYVRVCHFDPSYFQTKLT